MSRFKDVQDKLLVSLNERAKELKCLYEVETILNQADKDLVQVFEEVVKAIEPGWQYPEICRAEIEYGDKTIRSGDFEPTPWLLEAEIKAHGNILGNLHVYYCEERPQEDHGPFLDEEVRLIKSLAGRLGNFLLFQQLRKMEESWQAIEDKESAPTNEGWRMAVKMVMGTDQRLYLQISRKMLNHLCSIGVESAQIMLQEVDQLENSEDVLGEVNVAGPRQDQDLGLLRSLVPFELAAEHLGSEEIILRVQEWIQEDRASFLIKALSDPRSSLSQVADVVRRSRHVLPDGADLAPTTTRSLHVNLCEHFLNDQLNFIRIAKDYVKLDHFFTLLDRIIIPQDSHGKLGGKGAGLLLAKWILESNSGEGSGVGEFKVPQTWYLVSDGILKFIHYNDLEDVHIQKFREIDDIRNGYPNIIQLFKNSTFPPDIVHGLSSALDDFGEIPLIVRSSSLLEDRLGTAFSGKYKSLFLPNQGSKQERLDALLDAIAEIYASVFGPDPLEYRRERGLLEFHEEMGILIQEVVGRKVGKYFLPSFAGVAFSRNEFRWSPRIERDDGLIRLVPGLGTRAVDRIADDYPALAVPGKPNLRVNVALDEVVKYAPKALDLINLESSTFETRDLKELMKECGGQYPGVENVFSVFDQDMLRKPVKLMLDPESDHLVGTFAGLFDDTPFVNQVGSILKVLEDKLGSPVDVEFAHDGQDFYLLQCRPQSYNEDELPAPIPKDVAEEKIIFSANRYVSNGWLPDVTHLVYVDPERYANLATKEELQGVGRAVSKLNKVLPKRQFILMGPGRWGSRGDLKLGVSITYADINNTSMLVEIAKQSGNYVPDLSFGTHFFQDLVEARIRYLPLYPDEEDVLFNTRFLLGSDNLLSEMVPEYAHLEDVVRVIDVASVSEGRVLRVLMNADLDEAVGILSDPEQSSMPDKQVADTSGFEPKQFWQWRLRMVEKVASKLDAEKFGVVALYLFGSVKNATSGPASDIDLLVHFRGEDCQRMALEEWLEGWGLCLSEMNYLRTGYRTDNLLDVHLVTDEDIENRTSFAVKIGAVTDAARHIPTGP
ncbi:MAG: nucleotidyltransferase domain-containing protein [Gemmatimonadales bacterium]|nr:nucleotidyltransferase domain-containing protein [Gemmatimonadales bacterium]